jgi:DNA-directed RNA polymerase specialized sigma24 family protein
MNQQTADDLIEKAVKKAIKEYNKEQKVERKKKALHNTKLLLKNYRKIQTSIEEAVSDAIQLEQDYVIMDDNDELYVESIRRSKLRSLIVIAHIDKALALAEEECKQKNSSEKYDIFISCMLDGATYEEVAEQYDTSTQSISRWVTSITKSISIQLFGVEGLEFI